MPESTVVGRRWRSIRSFPPRARSRGVESRRSFWKRTGAGEHLGRRYDRLPSPHCTRILGPLPLLHSRRYSKYLSRDEFVEYLGEYARHLDLSVVTGCPVQKVRVESDRPIDVDRRDCSWRLTVGQSSSRPGNTAFRSCRSGADEGVSWVISCIPRATRRVTVPGKRVLVVGAGNSGH